MEDVTTILFGLPGVAVDLVSVDAAGARTVHVRTDDPTAAACPVCGVFSTSVRQHRTTAPKELPYGEAPLRVRWRKTQYRCREAGCPRKAFTESIAELPPGARVTGRLRRHAATAVGAGASVAATAGRLPVSWPTVHSAFVAHAETILTEPAAPIVLGIDETRRGRPQLDPRGGRRLVRLERFDPHAGYRAAVAEALPHARGEAWKAAVQVVAMDRPGRGRPLPPGTAGQSDGFRRPPAGRPRAAGTARPADRPGLGAPAAAAAGRRPALAAGPVAAAEVLHLDDPTNEIGAAWGLKELLRQLLAARDRSTIAHRLHRFHEAVLRADMPETTRLALTVDAWWPEILGFLQTRITNAGPKAPTGSSRTRPEWRSAFGTWTTSAVEYGSTAPGDHAEWSVQRRPCPLNFDEPPNAATAGTAAESPASKESPDLGRTGRSGPQPSQDRHSRRLTEPPTVITNIGAPRRQPRRPEVKHYFRSK